MERWGLHVDIGEGAGGPDVEKGAGASVWVGGWNPK